MPSATKVEILSTTGECVTWRSRSRCWAGSIVGHIRELHIFQDGGVNPETDEMYTPSQVGYHLLARDGTILESVVQEEFIWEAGEEEAETAKRALFPLDFALRSLLEGTPK